MIVTYTCNVERAIEKRHGPNGRLRPWRSTSPGLKDGVFRAKSDKHLRGGYVFCQGDGTMLTRGMCKHPLWRAAEAAGLGRIGWHVLRHTFASHLVIRGASMKQVQELLGHADIKMTMRYAHLSPEARREAVTLLDLPSSGTLAARGALSA